MRVEPSRRENGVSHGGAHAPRAGLDPRGRRPDGAGAAGDDERAATVPGVGRADDHRLQAQPQHLRQVVGEAGDPQRADALRDYLA